MLLPKLEQITKDGYTRNFGKIFDFGSIGTVKVSYHEESKRHDGDTNGWIGHLNCNSVDGTIEKKISPKSLASGPFIYYLSGLQQNVGAFTSRLIALHEPMRDSSCAYKTANGTEEGPSVVVRRLSRAQL